MKLAKVERTSRRGASVGSRRRPSAAVSRCGCQEPFAWPYRVSQSSLRAIKKSCGGGLYWMRRKDELIDVGVEERIIPMAPLRRESYREQLRQASLPKPAGLS